MDLIWLEDFLAIAEERGFSRAAERRHVTQPALSRRIRSLEKWLGTELFERSSHTLKLTPAGETFRHVAEDVLRRVLAGRQEALEVARLKAETIYVAATHALSQTFFPEWIRQRGGRRPGRRHPTGGRQFRGLRKATARCAGAIPARALPSVDREPAGRGSLSADRPRYRCAGSDQRAGREAVAAADARKKAQPRYALPGSADAPLPYLAYHPGSGVGRIVTAFLSAKDSRPVPGPGFSAPVTLLVEMAREGRGLTWAPRSLGPRRSRLRPPDARGRARIGTSRSASACFARAPA